MTPATLGLLEQARTHARRLAVCSGEIMGVLEQLGRSRGLLTAQGRAFVAVRLDRLRPRVALALGLTLAEYLAGPGAPPRAPAGGE